MAQKHWHPSPNYGPRKGGGIPEWVVLHYTAMPTCQSAIERLCDETAEVSAHYIIDEAGLITQMVDEHARAWHAGESFWQGIADMNSHTIGIELAHKGHVAAQTPFALVQIKSLIALLHDITNRWAIPKQNILAHSDIAIGRKIDPGEFFPWHQLAAEGLGVMPPPPCGTTAPSTPDMEVEIAALLTKMGYAETKGQTPEPIPLCERMEAFKRHYLAPHFHTATHTDVHAALKHVHTAFMTADRDQAHQS